jgi:acetylornithine deacetylase/succinyl-diaminopimelate desuccinylase-like protein
MPAMKPMTRAFAHAVTVAATTTALTAGLMRGTVATPAAADDAMVRVRAWRAAHEMQILRELAGLLSLPNVAANKADIEKNAQALTRMFERRRFLPESIATSGSPVVVAERRAPNLTRTLTFYFHYDGQPVDAREWTYGPPFSPLVVPAAGTAGRPIDAVTGPIDPGWRIYGRSSSDDKSPIVAFLAAIDALEASNIPLTSNVRLIVEGDEEAGSPSLEAVARQHGDRIRGDALLLVDGPRHASDRPTLSFGARGIMTAVITVFGPARDLHSGNYGNWAPNPALALARLLAGMKDDRGRITVPGFYDDVTPLTAEERRAIDEIPDVQPALMAAFGFSRPENPDERLELRHNLPTLNINALDAGGGVGGQGRTIIPASASAKLDLRLVKAIDPTRQFDRLVAYVRSQGFFIVDKEPDAALRAAHPWMAQVVRTGGYPAGRTAMDTPMAAKISKALADAAGGPIVRLPTIGGSAPFYVFTDVLKVPTFGLSVVNFDNNQHGANENVRIKNVWDAIESMAALLTLPN